MRKTYGLLTALLLAAVPAVVAQQPTTTQRAPVFRTAANLVRVDVVVRDKDGKVVKGLKDTDFQVLEDGKAQTVTSFSFQEIATDSLETFSPLGDLPLQRTRPIISTSICADDRPTGRGVT